MVRPLYLLSFVFSLCLCVETSNGQANKPVSWDFNAEPVTNNEVTLIAIAHVAPGWHIYSQFLEAGGPMPTRLTFEPSSDFMLTGKAEETGKPVTYNDAMYEMKITKYAGTVSFLQKIRLTHGSTVVKGLVEYMTCNNHICIPGKQEFNITAAALKQGP